MVFFCYPSYSGYNIDLRLAHLPKLKEVDLDMVRLNINNAFRQILFCALSMESLSMNVKKPEGRELSVFIKSVSMLSNMKKLRLAVGGSGYDCLLFLTSIMNACPNLETFSIKPCWTSPIITKKARVATNPHKNLKLVEIVEYKGRKCDFELAAYIIQTAVALKEVVISVSRDCLKKKAAESCTKLIESIKAQGVELVIV
ncbi:uncharacterized protein [Rutidosis leptorrhynchoides]|uniref:uncharacterized protein isoform X2 n=1 Tax=Rutidosis leptorrhynchoides TaxID=125765 RepID=UPI003A9A0861